MHFNKHLEIDGLHSTLSPSSPAWLRYDDEKLEKMFVSKQAAARGTREHAWAAETIKLGFRQAETTKTINLYINDCINYRMSPEVPLMYSEVCFGTADCIGFRDNVLRVFDYKSGMGATKVDQLQIYAALFCLEYDYSPFDITFDLRIYQHNAARPYETDPEVIFFIMQRIVSATRIAVAVRNAALTA